MYMFRSFWWCILVFLSEQKTPGVVQSVRETQPLHKPGDFSILKNKNPFQVSHVPGVERKCKQELYIVSISEWKVRDGVWGRHNFTGVSLVYNPEIPRSQTKGKACVQPTGVLQKLLAWRHVFQGIWISLKHERTVNQYEHCHKDLSKLDSCASFKVNEFFASLTLWLFRLLVSNKCDIWWTVPLEALVKGSNILVENLAM